MTPAALAGWHFPVGLAIGMAASAPMGPVNILFIQRVLQKSVPSALVLGLGAALGDALFAAIAAFGLSALTVLINSHLDPVRLVGGLLMLGFGVLLWRAAPHVADPGRRLPPTRHMAVAAFIMTITNPATLLWFAAAFGAVGFRDIGHRSPATLFNSLELVLGVLAGSMVWWLAVAAIARHLRQRLRDAHLVAINHVTAAILGLCGLAAIAAGLIG